MVRVLFDHKILVMWYLNTTRSYIISVQKSHNSQSKDVSELAYPALPSVIGLYCMH